MRMTQQMGKPRALEYLYSGRDIDADEGEKYGLINCAFGTSVEMHEFVDKYTERVGKFEITALATAKERVNDACNASSLEVFEKDFQAFMELMNLPTTAQLVTKVWEVIKGATDCEEERNQSDAIMTLPSYKQ
jgi:enoyl-CoA hydratase/carnithine racemase